MRFVSVPAHSIRDRGAEVEICMAQAEVSNGFAEKPCRFFGHYRTAIPSKTNASDQASNSKRDRKALPEPQRAASFLEIDDGTRRLTNPFSGQTPSTSNEQRHHLDRIREVVSEESISVVPYPFD